MARFLIVPPHPALSPTIGGEGWGEGAPLISLWHEHRTGQHASGDISDFEPVLQKDARRVVGALGGATDDENLAVAGEFAQACPELAQPGEKLFAGAGRGDRGPEDPDDRGALGAAETESRPAMTSAAIRPCVIM